MKVTFRIPTQDQYAFVELELEDEANNITAEAIRGIYDGYTQAFKPKAGISEKDFNAHVDRMMTKGEANHIEEYLQMSDKQKDYVQFLKRAIKRIKPKQ